LQDIAKKNSDFTIGLSLPGSKKNNRFFENFFNVDAQSLYFNATKRQLVDVLLGDEPLFRGYMRLNKVNVQNSKVEYDITLYSTVGNLFGDIGNNLLADLDFGDDEYTFNHVFNLSNTTQQFNYTNFSLDRENPYPYVYPVVHNGYVYSGDTIILSGSTTGATRFYTSTSPISSYSTLAAAYSAGVEKYHINSPTQGLMDNQLKPALNMWSLIKLIFKTYGYTIKSDFFNTPWMKTLYMYGYFSSPQTKFSYKINNILELPLEGVEVIFYSQGGQDKVVVCKLGTGVPCYCLSDINVVFQYDDGFSIYDVSAVIPALTTGYTNTSYDIFYDGYSNDVPNGTNLKYFPVPVGSDIAFVDGDFVDFSIVVDQNIKQIDIISSIAKKFNLIFVTDPDVPNQFIIEPYDFYVGTGNIYDWTPKLSWDKGFSVEPALNYVESTLLLTDAEDNDEGNKQFKAQNNRTYGRNIIYNPTDFKSQDKTIDTIYSPELIRKWDKDGVNNIGLPLGINYVATNKEIGTGNTTSVAWQYTGVKTKPKLFFWMGGFNPFLDVVGETFTNNNYSTYSVYVSDSLETFYFQSDRLPVISHTMPMGMADADKINNDSLSILFNSEQPVNIGVQTFNVYTEQDAYNKFYNNRITNIYDPNTRFLSGYFDLKYSDVRNLKPNDIIKINEQHFILNKIADFNLTQRELTKVELIQFNVNPQTYPDRYFQYYYCDNPSKVYKFKTDFTNPNLLDTNFGWSVYYDHQVGSLTGQTSGFTSSFKGIEGFTTVKYYPYTMYEVSQTTYDSSGIDWQYDTMMDYIYSNSLGPFLFNMPTFWLNSGATFTGINVWDNCTQFNTTRTTYGLLTGSSTYHGVSVTPTPTPTSTPAPTPTGTPPMLGSLIMSFDELVPDRGIDNYSVNVNGLLRDVHFTEVDNLYSTNLNPGDVVSITIIRENVPSTASTLGVSRRDYTTDDQGSDMGIRDTFITGVTGTSTSLSVTFTATTIAQDYNFEYRVTGTTYNAATPTPSPSPSSTSTPTPTPTPLCNLPLRTINWEFDYSYTSDISTGFTIAEIDMFNYPVTGYCIGKGLEPVNYFTPATYVNYSGLTGGTVFTGSTSFSGQTDGLRNLAIAQNMCYQPSSWPSIMRNGSTVKLYINNIFIKNYDRWETPAGNLYLMGMVQCTGLTQYTRTYIYFDNVTINPNDNVKIVFDDNFITPWQSSQYVYKYNNSADTQRYLTGYTFGDGYYVPQFTQTLTGYTGSYSGTTYITNTSGLTDPQVYIRNSNNDNPDTIVTRTVKWYKDNVVQTAYTLTLTGTTIPKIPSAKTAIYTTFPKPAFGTTNVWEIEDTFVGVPPTPTPTNSPTPTPTATPLPATIAYRYDATSTFSGTTKTASTLTVRFDGNIVHTRSNASYTTSTDTTSTATNIDNGYIGSAITITLNRDLTKSISSSEFVTTRTWFLYINGGLIESINDSTNYNIPITPTVLSQTNSFTPVTLAYGDVVEVRWRDIIVV
jgi:hypothetical protein